MIKKFFREEIALLQKEGLIDKVEYSNEQPIRKLDDKGQIKQHEILLVGAKEDETIGVLYVHSDKGQSTMERIIYTGPIWAGKNDDGEHCDAWPEHVATFNSTTKEWKRV